MKTLVLFAALWAAEDFGQDDLKQITFFVIEYGNKTNPYVNINLVKQDFCKISDNEINNLLHSFSQSDNWGGEKCKWLETAKLNQALHGEDYTSEFLSYLSQKMQENEQ